MFSLRTYLLSHRSSTRVRDWESRVIFTLCHVLRESSEHGLSPSAEDHTLPPEHRRTIPLCYGSGMVRSGVVDNEVTQVRGACVPVKRQKEMERGVELRISMVLFLGFSIYLFSVQTNTIFKSSCSRSKMYSSTVVSGPVSHSINAVQSQISCLP